MVVEGPPGIGKTALVAAAREWARAAGLRTLAARGTELERAFGFGVARQLLEPAVHDARFDGAARYAAPLLDVPLAEPVHLPLGPEGAFAVLHGLYLLTAELAPLALLVDDAHWADAASLRYLAYLANRLSRTPVLLVLAARPPGEPGGAAVAELLPEPLLLRPHALSEDASAALVRFAVPDAAPALCRDCHGLTGGNPFFLSELVGALHDAGPAAALAAAPEGVVASVRARLARFPEPAQRLAGAAAVVGDGALVRHAAALAELDDHEAAEAADALRAGRILADDTRAAVRPPDHPQRGLRAAVAGGALGRPRASGAPARRRGRSARAGGRASARDGAARLGVDLRPPARGRAPGDPARRAGRLGHLFAARARGAAHAESRPSVLLELGLAESLTLDREPAIEHLRQGVETTRDTLARLYAARTLAAMVGMRDPAQAVAIVERALAASPDADPVLATHIEAHMVLMGRWSLGARRATAERAARLRERVEAGELDGAMELTLAATEVTMAGDSAERAAELATRAIEGLRADPILAVVIGFASRCLILADRLDDADRVLTTAIDEAHRQRANYRVGPLLVFRSDARFRAGALRDALADAEAAHTAYAHAGRLTVLGSALARVQALLELGELEAADAALAAVGELDDGYSDTLLLNARARLRLAQGEARAALADALEVGRRQVVMREPNPAAMDWRSLAALAQARPGAGARGARTRPPLRRPARDWDRAADASA